MSAPEPQTWAWGDEEPEPTPGWEFETRWEFGGGEYTRVYTRPVIRHVSPRPSEAECEEFGHEFYDQCGRCGVDAHEYFNRSDR